MFVKQLKVRTFHIASAQHAARQLFNSKDKIAVNIKLNRAETCSSQHKQLRDV